MRVIHAGVGAISKSDVSLADASNAIIIGFNVRPDAVAKAEAEQTGVEMRMYRVIYDAINDVTDAMKGMLAPKIREVALGEAQVRQVYKISSVGTVAGCRVTRGKITRDAKLRLVRDGIVITEDAIASLKRSRTTPRKWPKASNAASRSRSSPTSRKATSSSASSWKNTATDAAQPGAWRSAPGRNA